MAPTKATWPQKKPCNASATASQKSTSSLASSVRTTASKALEAVKSIGKSIKKTVRRKASKSHASSGMTTYSHIPCLTYFPDVIDLDKSDNNDDSINPSDEQRAKDKADLGMSLNF